MPPGRVPQPTAVKALRGNPGRRPLNAAEPKPASRIPSPPSHLSGHALVEWKRVVRELHAIGVLTEIDRATLSAYAQAYGRWVEAEESLAAMAERDNVMHALIIKTVNGNTMQNPLVTIANAACAAMVKYAAELGMTPSARSRIKATPPEEQDEAESYFN